jgi:Ankyrin repeats (3 copies)
MLNVTSELTSAAGPATISTFLSLETTLAQHLFMSFLWAIANSIASDKLELNSRTSVKRAETFKVDDPASILSLRLENDVLVGLATTIRQTGLGSLEDAYACIIPPLSHFQKLPNQAVVAFVRQQMRDQERRVHWDAWKMVVEMYMELFQMLTTSPHRRDSIGMVGAILANLCWALAYASKQKVNQKRADGLEQLSQLAAQIVELLDLQCSQRNLPTQSFLLEFKKLYRKGQDFDYVDLPKGGPPEAEDSDEPAGEIQQATSEPAKIDSAFRKLLEHPSIFNRIDKTTKRNAGKKLGRDLDLQARDLCDWTPLHYAVARGNVYAVERLLQMGSNPNAVDVAGWTPLHYAIQTGKDREDTSTISIVRDILQNGANIDLAGRDGIFPLHCAARKPGATLTEVLLQVGARVDVQDNSGMTPLHWAAYTGSVEPLKALLRRGAYRGARDDYDRTPLHVAAVLGMSLFPKPLAD